MVYGFENRNVYIKQIVDLIKDGNYKGPKIDTIFTFKKINLGEYKNETETVPGTAWEADHHIYVGTVRAVGKDRRNRSSMSGRLDQILLEAGKKIRNRESRKHYSDLCPKCYSKCIKVLKGGEEND